MSRRNQIQMNEAELGEFLTGMRVMTCATVGPNGRPHLMPLWFAFQDGKIVAWTYARSQKALNLARDPRATLQFEAGETYDQLRGAMLECDVELRSDEPDVAAVGRLILERYAPSGDGVPIEIPPDIVARQAAKRVALIFHPTRTVTWDHRKLGGTY